MSSISGEMANNSNQKKWWSLNSFGRSIKTEDNKKSNEYRPINAKDDQSIIKLPRNIPYRIG